MKKKDKKRVKQATEQVSKALEKQKEKSVKSATFDYAELERKERERDEALDNLSPEVKQIIDTYKTKFDRMERAVGNTIKELAEDLRAQFLKEKKPLLVTCICTIISNAVSGKNIVSDRWIRKLLGEQYKDPLQRMRAMMGGTEEIETEDIIEARENPKGAADYKTEEIGEVSNPVTLKQIAQVKSQTLDYKVLEIEDLKKDRDHWKQQAEYWKAKYEGKTETKRPQKK